MTINKASYLIPVVILAVAAGWWLNSHYHIKKLAVSPSPFFTPTASSQPETSISPSLTPDGARNFVAIKPATEDLRETGQIITSSGLSFAISKDWQLGRMTGLSEVTKYFVTGSDLSPAQGIEISVDLNPAAYTSPEDIKGIQDHYDLKLADWVLILAYRIPIMTMVVT